MTNTEPTSPAAALVPTKPSLLQARTLGDLDDDDITALVKALRRTGTVVGAITGGIAGGIGSLVFVAAGPLPYIALLAAVIFAGPSLRRLGVMPDQRLLAEFGVDAAEGKKLRAILRNRHVRRAKPAALPAAFRAAIPTTAGPP